MTAVSHTRHSCDALLAGSTPRLSVEPADALTDQPLSITLAGLPAGATVRVSATSDNLFCLNADPVRAYGLPHWSAQAIFTAGADGTVNLERDAPVEGDWERPCAGAPLPFLHPTRLQPQSVPKASHHLADVPVPSAYNVRITADIADGATLEAHAWRRFYVEDMRVLDIEDAGFVGRYFSPTGEEPLPAIVVMSGSEGRIEKAQTIASVFASRGYRALALCYFGLKGTTKHLDRIPLELVESAVRWLQARSEVDHNRIALYGRSKGGELALAAASLIPSVTCVIANTPSPICYEGLRGKLPCRHASWTWRGKELPFVKIPVGALMRAPFALATNHQNFTRWLYERTLSANDLEAARFPLERINGPILVSSERDEIWPSRLHGDMTMAALDAASFPFRHAHLTCREAGHTLTVPYQPAFALPHGIDAAAWALDTQRAWSATLDFLDDWQRNQP